MYCNKVIPALSVALAIQIILGELDICKHTQWTHIAGVCLLYGLLFFAELIVSAIEFTCRPD